MVGHFELCGRRLISSGAGFCSIIPDQFLLPSVSHICRFPCVVPPVFMSSYPILARTPGTAVLPGEHTMLTPDRVVYQSYLKWKVEEALLNKAVSIGKEDAEVGMSMIPADDALARIGGVHLLMDVTPGGMSER